MQASPFSANVLAMASSVKKILSKKSQFHELLQAQVGNEFSASQQYIALAVWFDNEDLPRLAAHFYKQALEERNHAMMIVQFLMDNDIPVVIPGTETPINEFKAPRDLVALALRQEQQVTDQIVALAKAAREEGDYIGEQFLQWFLKEQVEEVSSMKTLLTIMDRADGNMFYVETFLTRESVGDEGADSSAPSAAGGAL
jgi:ferritin